MTIAKELRELVRLSGEAALYRYQYGHAAANEMAAIVEARVQALVNRYESMVRLEDDLDAKDEEIARLQNALRAAQSPKTEAKKTAKAGLEAIAGLVRKVENSVTGSAGQYPTVEGVESVSVQLSNIERLVVSGSGIWVHESTYDDSYSWRIAYDETIATEIRALAALLNK